MIWIIGGTSEAAALAERMGDRYPFRITAATDREKEFVGSRNLIVRRMGEADMEEFIRRNEIRLIIDMSHPYAFEVTKNAREAAETCRVEYIRYERVKTEDTEGCIRFDSLPSCLEFLKTVEGCVFFTTGSKNIRDFETVRGGNRFVYRVLPAAESLKECVGNQVKMKDVIAALGPFSEDFNAAMFREYGADYVVMKDSGRPGGTDGKIRACRKLGTKAVLIGRKEEEGSSDMEEIMRKVEDMAASR